MKYFILLFFSLFFIFCSDNGKGAGIYIGTNNGAITATLAKDTDSTNTLPLTASLFKTGTNESIQSIDVTNMSEVLFVSLYEGTYKIVIESEDKLLTEKVNIPVYSGETTQVTITINITITINNYYNNPSSQSTKEDTGESTAISSFLDPVQPLSSTPILDPTSSQEIILSSQTEIIADSPSSTLSSSSSYVTPPTLSSSSSDASPIISSSSESTPSSNSSNISSCFQSSSSSNSSAQSSSSESSSSLVSSSSSIPLLMVIQPGPVASNDASIGSNIIPGNDSYDHSIKNNGLSNVLSATRFDGNTASRILIKIETTSIPPGSTVHSAVLVLFPKSWYPKHLFDDYTLHAHAILRPWNAGYGDIETNSMSINGATAIERFWGDQDGSEDWDQPFVGLNDIDASTMIYDTDTHSYNDPSIWQFTITPLVETWINNPESNYGLLIRNPHDRISENNVPSFPLFHSANSTEATSRPHLVIQYSL